MTDLYSYSLKVKGKTRPKPKRDDVNLIEYLEELNIPDSQILFTHEDGAEVSTDLEYIRGKMEFGASDFFHHFGDCEIKGTIYKLEKIEEHILND